VFYLLITNEPKYSHESHRMYAASWSSPHKQKGMVTYYVAIQNCVELYHLFLHNLPFFSSRVTANWSLSHQTPSFPCMSPCSCGSSKQRVYLWGMYVYFCVGFLLFRRLDTISCDNRGIDWELFYSIWIATARCDPSSSPSVSETDSLLEEAVERRGAGRPSTGDGNF
jgi:hypothetical protein